MKRNQYRLVVPSRGRAEQIPGLMALLPSATICVDEGEEADYKPVVPRRRLLLHPPLPSMGAIRQWILDNVKTRSVCMCDDDLTAVVCMVGRKTRRITDPVAIQQIIENGVQICDDLEIPLFGWNRDAQLLHFRATNSFKIRGLVMMCFVVRGRELRFDPELSDREDVDISLRSLEACGVTLVDRRFYFASGGYLQGKGGLQGVRTEEYVREGRETLLRRWGRYVVFGASKGGTEHVSVRVPGKNSAAITK